MRRVCLVLVMFAALWSFAIVEAQGLGGLIKKKVQEKTKPKDAGAQAGQGAASNVGFEVTEAVLESFYRGVKLELQMHQDYLKRLAALKTQEQYQECTGRALLSPEGSKVNEEFQNRMQKVTTTEEMLKVQEWLAKALEPVTRRHCGEDPRRVRLQQVAVLRRAELAGAAEFGRVWDQAQPPPNLDQSGGPAGNPHPWADWCASGEDVQEDSGSPEGLPWFGGCRGSYAAGLSPAADGIHQQEKDRATILAEDEEIWRQYQIFCAAPKGFQDDAAEHGGTIVPRSGGAAVAYSKEDARSFRRSCEDNRRYRLMKEWYPAFCALPKWVQDDMADNNGGTIGPGLMGAGLSYTVEQARWFRKSCNSTLIKLADAVAELLESAGLISKWSPP